jgi:acyl-CoA reductase-like NAD-dependent aldehyde dehydrogenase
MNSLKTITTPWSSGDPKDFFTVHNPANGEPIGQVQGADSDGVDRAVRCAHETFQKTWRHVTVEERGDILLKCSLLIEEHAEELAKLESDEMGKPVTQSMGDVKFCITAFKLFAGMARNMPSHVHQQGPVLSVSTLEPFGVVGGIIPFNWPPIHTAGKVAPALAVGNCIVIKPPEQDPFTIMKIVELINTILPEGVVTVVPGLGNSGAALAGHPLIKMLSFTGSPVTGRAVTKTLAENLSPALMELGGKNPVIIFQDADVETAALDMVEAAYFNQGEACTAASRILVHESLHDILVERMKVTVPRLRVGDPHNPGTHVGPLVTKAQQQRVLAYIDIGIKEGAVIAAQAPVPTDEHLKDGYWVAPTLFINVKPGMRIEQEEIFGPVTVIIPFSTYEEAIEIANDTDFGLVASVYSNDFKKCWKASRDIDAGMFFINNYYRMGVGTPFGGCKHSGHGREHNSETLREFGYMKTTKFTTGLSEVPKWFAVEDVCKG